MNEPTLIAEPNISLAWAKAFLAVYRGEVSNATPLTVSAGDFNGGLTPEVAEIRQVVDTDLRTHGKLSSKMNADLIFPQTLWQQTKPLGRAAFFNRYIEDYYPRLKARDSRRNGKGTYFLRMVGWGLPPTESSDGTPVNQLEHIIALYTERAAHGQRPRSSALQISCFDPARDHTKAVRSIFPCLQQIGLVYDTNNSLFLNAYYPSQYIFDRAYGNYLGLTNLGRFLASELGLTFRRLTCFIGSPKLGDVNKGSLRSLAELLSSIVSNRDSNGGNLS